MQGKETMEAVADDKEEINTRVDRIKPWAAENPRTAGKRDLLEQTLY